MRAAILLSVLLLQMSLAREARADDSADLAAEAKKILQTHCYRCHGDKGAVEGGVNYILNRDQLVRRRKILPGNADKSRLLRRVVEGDMPPEGEKRPSKEEIATLQRWVA